jgi:hypothetical protein
VRGAGETGLQQWEAEQNYITKIELAHEAARMRAIDPLPETLEGNYNYLRDASNQVAEIVSTMDNRMKEWERGIELATRKASVEHALRLGGQVLDQRNAMQDSPLWPETYANECNSLLNFAKEVITEHIGAWIPRQSCESPAQVADFRRRTQNQANWLSGLGFVTEAHTR